MNLFIYLINLNDDLLNFIKLQIMNKIIYFNRQN